jgi:hypothetical protein
MDRQHEYSLDFHIPCRALRLLLADTAHAVLQLFAPFIRELLLLWTVSPQVQRQNQSTFPNLSRPLSAMIVRLPWVLPAQSRLLGIFISRDVAGTCAARLKDVNIA